MASDRITIDEIHLSGAIAGRLNGLLRDKLGQLWLAVVLLRVNDHVIVVREIDEYEAIISD